MEVNRIGLASVDHLPTGSIGESMHGRMVVADGIEFRWVAAWQGGPAKDAALMLDGSESSIARGVDGQFITAGTRLRDCDVARNGGEISLAAVSR